MTSVAAWVADQVAELTRPLIDRQVRDVLRRLRVDISVRFDLED